MTITEALKEFYKDNVTDVNKLNDADSVLEVLRAKYGDYKGSNIAEYIQELVENDITPGGSTPTGTIYVTENGEGIDVSSYATADVNVSGGGATLPTFTYNELSVSCDMTYTEVKSYWNENKDGNDVAPCKTFNELLNYFAWATVQWNDDAGWIAEYYVPEGTEEIIAIAGIDVAYCIDNNFYPSRNE